MNIIDKTYGPQQRQFHIYTNMFIHIKYCFFLELALDFRSQSKSDRRAKVSLKMALSCRQTCRQFHKGANTRLVAPAATQMMMMMIVQQDETMLIMTCQRRDETMIMMMMMVGC